MREDSGDLNAIGEILRWKEQALKSNSSNMYCNFNYLKGSPCVFGRAELASAMCSGCWDYVTSLSKKKNKGNVDCWLHSHCCLLPHQFWTGSKLCSSGGSATSRLYYFVTLARLLLLLCYYPYKKQTILHIAANNFLDHDLILFRIYSARGGFLRVMMGYFQVGTNASGMARPCPCLPTPGILGTENFSYGPIFLVSRTVRNGSADLRNGSERFCRPQVCTEIFLRSFHPPPKKKGQEQFLLLRIFKTFQRAALWLQGPRLQEKEESEKRQREGNFSA